MLGWLPDNATLETFDLVKAELQHRTNLMAESSVETGAAREVLLSGVALTPNIFMHVLEFVPRYDAVLKASLVSKSWLAVTRAPQFWHTLDNESCLLAKSTTITNMTSLLELLGRPQFGSLKSLTPFNKVLYCSWLITRRE